MGPTKDAPPKDGFYRALGRKLRLAREGAGLSQEKAAKIIGMSRTSMTNIECGRQPLQVHVLVHLAAVFNVSVNDLLPESGAFVADPGLEARLQSLDKKSRDWALRVLSQSTDPKEMAGED